MGEFQGIWKFLPPITFLRKGLGQLFDQVILLEILAESVKIWQRAHNKLIYTQYKLRVTWSRESHFDLLAGWAANQKKLSFSFKIKKEPSGHMYGDN